ncbi:MAG: hypothetical protein LUQ38_06945 [Methanotrichaceae archaeon]|nr:hypothetical protein [Methanotrichaceae archaeon]MDD1757140.1 hypothetical protein [Methanotrichaceae archaeon]
MKIVSIPSLAFALVALASTCFAFTPTSEDMAWKTAAINDAALIKSDADNIVANAGLNYNTVAIQRYSDLLEDHAGNALRKSQASSVSPELQNAKNYYERALASFQIGAQKVSQGCTLANPMVRKDGEAEINKGIEYLKQAVRELKTVAG